MTKMSSITATRSINILMAVPSSILAFDFQHKQTNCVLAKYKGNDNSAYILLIQYQNSDLADDAYHTFLAAYMPKAKESGIVQAENKTWTMTKTQGSILIVVLEADQKDFGMNLMAQIKT